MYKSIRFHFLDVHLTYLYCHCCALWQIDICIIWKQTHHNVI